MSKPYRTAVAVTAFVAATVLIPATSAQARPEGCVPGFAEPGTVRLDGYLEAPRHVAGVAAGVYTVEALTARFRVIDEDGDRAICLKAVSNLRGSSAANWGFFYLAGDA